MKVAINGFGRIGKNLTRQLIEKNFLEGNQELELVAVNDLGSIETNAHLLKYDSIHGKIDNNISSLDNKIIVDEVSESFVVLPDNNATAESKMWVIKKL